MKRTKLFFCSFAFACMIFISGCSSGLSGTYLEDGHAHFDKLVFTSGSKVDIYFMGSAQEGNYEINGNKLKVSNAVGNIILTIDENGCLDGGDLVGKYCKE